MTKRKGKGGPVDLGDLGESFGDGLLTDAELDALMEGLCAPDLGDLGESFGDGLLTDAELDALMGEPAFWDLPEADGILGDGDSIFHGCTDWDPFDEDRDLPDGGQAKGKPKKNRKGRRWNGTNS